MIDVALWCLYFDDIYAIVSNDPHTAFKNERFYTRIELKSKNQSNFDIM
jgi:hypothetical protein